MKMVCRRVGKASVIVGFGMILVAIALICNNQYENERAMVLSSKAVLVLSETVPHTEPVIETTAVISDERKMLEEFVDGIPYIGVLKIPELNLELPIISNWSKDNGKIAPCRYRGSVYLKDLIICAHNYKSHFGNIGTLSIGDCVFFTDVEGNTFLYSVVEMEVLGGTAIEQMESGDWDLTLFTCTVGGKSRITVRCERAE